MPKSKANQVNSTSCRSLALLAVVTLAGQPLFVQAEGLSLDWAGQALEVSPMYTGKVWSNQYGFFPSQESLNGNTVRVSDGAAIAGDVYGAVTADSEDVSGNSVIISGDGNVTGKIVAGGVSWNGNATGNTVEISGGALSGVIYGGYSAYGNATDNTIEITNGSVGSWVYGGFIEKDGDAINNKVLISGGSIGGRVYGGVASYGGNAIGNTVVLTGGTGYTQITGGYSNQGAANGNTVEISDVDVTQTIYGGDAGVEASGNTVKIFSGSVGGNVYGGRTSGTAANNTVAISDGSVAGVVYGGNGNTGASDNIIAISGGSVAGSIYGGVSSKGDAAGNRVEISGGSMSGYVVGGWSRSSNATDNMVVISGGSVGQDVYGGESREGAATGNMVEISGGTVSGNIIGGISATDATHNTVIISDEAQLVADNALLLGGYTTGTGNVFTGNTLNFSAQPITVSGIGNFQYYNFTLDPSLVNKEAALITADTVVLGDGNGASSEVKVIGIQSGNVLSVGDQFVLMTAADMSGDGLGAQSNVTQAQQGISLLYNVQTTVDINENQVTAEILGAPSSAADIIFVPVPEIVVHVTTIETTEEDADADVIYDIIPEATAETIVVDANIIPDSSPNSGPGSAATVNPQLKSLSEGRLAGLMLATRGADVVADQLYSTIQTENPGGLVPFILAAGAANRYNSGSHIDSDDFLLTGGLSYRHEGLTAAVFAESGWGNYDTYNSFATMASVRADGNTRYTGGGVFGRYDFTSGLYAEASVRLGNTRTRFDTGDLVNLASGESASYNLHSRYTSAHAGVGYPWVLDDSNLLDVSAKYLWTHIDGKDATVAGDPLHFDSVQSQRVRLNGEYRHRHSDSVTLLAGLGYEYEFDAKANGTAYGYAIDAPSLKGSTGILSLGATIAPTSSRRLSVDLRGEGYVGKREGVGGLVRVNYVFL